MTERTHVLICPSQTNQTFIKEYFNDADDDECLFIVINIQVRDVILLYRSVCTQCLAIGSQNGIHIGQRKCIFTRGDGIHLGQGRWKLYFTRGGGIHIGQR